MRVKKYFLLFVILNVICCVIWSHNIDSDLWRNRNTEEEIIKLIYLVNSLILIWLGIKAKDSINERYLYIVLALISNPIYSISELHSIIITIKILMAVILAVILFLCFERTNIISFLNKNKKRIMNLTVGCIVIILIGWGYNVNKKYKLEEKIKLEKIAEEKEVAKQDSINESNRIKKIEYLKSVKWMYCNESSALINFKSHLEINYPLYKLKKEPLVTKNGDCRYTVTSILKKTDDPYYNNEPYIVNIDLNADGEYKKYNIEVISKSVFVNNKY
jgi:hypothetical protein